ncbi:hypothetical protein [Cryptosporangium sp. NPDC051539]|uniref:hypothetical protein n=1 Tax=Cryptosporangium sp. NPDC051539 TaxID=3363962 RepID=UPI00379BDDBD
MKALGLAAAVGVSGGVLACGLVVVAALGGPDDGGSPREPAPSVSGFDAGAVLNDANTDRTLPGDVVTMDPGAVDMNRVTEFSGDHYW